jgi:hypothetical protein
MNLKISLMKKLPGIFPYVLVITVLLLSNCSDDDDTKSIARAQMEKLSGKWKVTSVHLGGVGQEGFEDFVLTISEIQGKEKLSYLISGNPYKSPWTSVSTGQFTFDENEPTRSLIREDGVTIEYTVTEQELLMSFAYDTSSTGRLSGVEGNWEFTFKKEQGL